MKPTREEKQARAIAQKIIDALAEVECFLGDPEMIFEDIHCITPKKQLTVGQVAEVQKAAVRLGPAFGVLTSDEQDARKGIS